MATEMTKMVEEFIATHDANIGTKVFLELCAEDNNMDVETLKELCEIMKNYIYETSPSRIKSFPQLMRKQMTRADGSIYFQYEKSLLINAETAFYIPNPILTSPDVFLNEIHHDLSYSDDVKKYDHLSLNAAGIPYTYLREMYIAHGILMDGQIPQPPKYNYTNKYGHVV